MRSFCTLPQLISLMADGRYVRRYSCWRNGIKEDVARGFLFLKQPGICTTAFAHRWSGVRKMLKFCVSWLWKCATWLGASRNNEKVNWVNILLRKYRITKGPFERKKWFYTFRRYFWKLLCNKGRAGCLYSFQLFCSILSNICPPTLLCWTGVGCLPTRFF